MELLHLLCLQQFCRSTLSLSLSLHALRFPLSIKSSSPIFLLLISISPLFIIIIIALCEQFLCYLLLSLHHLLPPILPFFHGISDISLIGSSPPLSPPLFCTYTSSIFIFFRFIKGVHLSFSAAEILQEAELRFCAN